MAQWRTDFYEFKQPHNVHLYEMNMVADEKGNPINGSNPTGMAVDAFGRARSSQPFTLLIRFIDIKTMVKFQKRLLAVHLHTMLTQD